MKKIISWLIVVAMLMAMVPAVFAEETATYTKITSMDELTTGSYVMTVGDNIALNVVDGTWITTATPTVDGDKVTDAAGAVWTVTVSDGTVSLKDSNGVYIAPKGGNNNGLKTGNEYAWAVNCTEGVFTFAGQGSDTVVLAYNSDSQYMKFRGYKTTTVSGAPDTYPSEFTLYKLDGAGETTPEESTPDESEPAYVAPEDGATITIAEAIEAAQNGATGKYYMTGVVTELRSTTWGNMVIEDETGSILIYGMYDADGNRYDAMAEKPVVGDTVTVYSSVEMYNTTPEAVNATLIELIPAVDPYEPPAEGTVLTIAEANEVATHSPDYKYYITGTVTEIVNTTYGNLYIQDENGDSLYIYGLYDADGTNRFDVMETQPVVGDTITIYTVLTTYNSTPQAKNAWLIEIASEPTTSGSFTVPAYSNAQWTAPATGTIKVTTDPADAFVAVLEGWTELATFTGTGTVKVVEGTTYGFYTTYDADFVVNWEYVEDDSDEEDPGEDVEPVTGPLSLGDNNVVLSAGDMDGETWTYTATEAGSLTVTVTALSYLWDGMWTEMDAMGFQYGFGRMYALTVDGVSYYTYTATINVEANQVVPVGLMCAYGYETKATINLTMGEPETGDDEENLNGNFIGSGTMDDPYIIESLPVDLAFTLNDANYCDIYFKYVVVADGIIEFSNATCEVMWIVNDEWKNGTALEVTAGQEILVNTYTYAGAGNYSVSLTFTADEEPVTNPFTDVAEGKYYYDAVLWAVENGITTGKTDTTFAPDSSCTRAQVVTFLWRAAGCPEPTLTENPFTDVSEDSTFYKAILWAVENGITTGKTETTFAPGSTCTREQIVMFLWRYMGEPAPTTTENPFTDVEENSKFYSAILWAVEMGITTGKTETTFAPDSECTRAMIVTFLYRAQDQN